MGRKKEAEEKAAGIGSLLDEDEGRSKPKKRPVKDEDLDFDSAWNRR